MGVVVAALARSRPGPAEVGEQLMLVLDAPLARPQLKVCQSVSFVPQEDNFGNAYVGVELVSVVLRSLALQVVIRMSVDVSVFI